MRKLASPQLAAKMASKGLSYKEIGRRLEIAPDHAEWLVKKHRLGYSTAPKTIREDGRMTLKELEREAEEAKLGLPHRI